MADREPRVGVEEIRSYLTSKAWRPEITGRVAEVWKHAQNDGAELLVSVVESASDFGKRVEILVKDLKNFEGRPSQAISYDIATMYYDVTNLEARHPRIIRDSIPLDAGFRLFQSAQKLIVAAAGATIRRQRHFSHSMPLQARRHARHVRLGQTRRGSYILPIISEARAMPEITDQQEIHLDLGVEESLFDRRVMVTFANALETLEEIAVRYDRTPSRPEVLEAVSEGISRELCQALESVIKSESVADLEVSFNWAPAVPVPEELAKEVSFPKDSATVIEKIAEDLRTSPYEREDVLYGLITDLHWDPGENERGRRVGIETVIERRRRTVWFDLDPMSYEQALRYHRQRQRVVVRGVLRTVSGQQPTIQVSYFGPDQALRILDGNDIRGRN